MKHYRSLLSLAAGGLAAVALMLAGCGEKKPRLHIYNWSDYFAPEVLEMFEERFGVEVVYDVFESNEAMYAKLKAGGGGYDVVFPSSYQAYIMNKEGMLLALDHAQLPNLQYIDREHLNRFAIDKELHYSVPYMSGTTGIAYRADRVGELDKTWGVFSNPEFAGRMTLLNDPREVIGAALKFLGYSLNTTDPNEIAQAVDVVLQWKRNIAKFAADEYKPGLASGEFHISQGYSGDIMQVMEENEDLPIEYFLPREGFSVWVDDVAILKNAPNPELAHQFINFLHDPEVAAINMEYIYYQCPNTAAYELIDEELRSDEMVFLSEEDLGHGELIQPLDEEDRLYMEAWARIKGQE